MKKEKSNINQYPFVEMAAIEILNSMMKNDPKFYLTFFGKRNPDPSNWQDMLSDIREDQEASERFMYASIGRLAFKMQIEEENNVIDKN